MDKPLEIIGHVMARLTVALSLTEASANAKDIDLFVTLRHLDVQGKEVQYQNAIGGPCPVTKGWLRCSMRAVDEEHPLHRAYRPYRAYRRQDESFLAPNKDYTVDVEIWPTMVVLGVGEQLVLEVASGDTPVSMLLLRYV